MLSTRTGSVARGAWMIGIYHLLRLYGIIAHHTYRPMTTPICYRLPSFLATVRIRSEEVRLAT